MLSLIDRVKFSFQTPAEVGRPICRVTRGCGCTSAGVRVALGGSSLVCKRLTWTRGQVRDSAGGLSSCNAHCKALRLISGQGSGSLDSGDRFHEDARHDQLRSSAAVAL